MKVNLYSFRGIDDQRPPFINNHSSLATINFKLLAFGEAVGRLSERVLPIVFNDHDLTALHAIY